MEPWEIWIRSTALSEFVLAHQSWLWAVLETIHFIGLSLLLGTVGLFDLRILGLAPAIPPSALHRLVPWGVLGFALNLATGTLFFFGFPDQYAYNPAFWTRVVLLAVAGANMALFYSLAFAPVRDLGAGEEVPVRATVMTSVSLVAWTGVLICGRLLTFFRPDFLHG